MAGIEAEGTAVEACPGAFRRLGPLGDELGPPSADDIRAWFLSKGSSHFDLRRTHTLAAGTVAFGDGRRGYVVAGTDASVRDELIHRLHNAVRRFERALHGRELRVLERKDVTRDDPHGQLVVTADTAAGALRISLAEEGWFVAPDTPGAESRRLRRLDKTTDVRVKGRDSFDDLAHDIHAILIANALRD
ncbi:hypothetical protein [Actinoallomurus iriomotensis]|uniref:Uncharacterized protein n=1 Tax=Actinoallomurus iriomotensis TaxID=478107 RepID=A0A9W6RFZ2_9ACTN|nr:hypothetical protein [Actinoallomurus iriomotensis]GLY75058.1 hypothetical protein Airi01_033250 [Actinoallomurus iriomotensis]